MSLPRHMIKGEVFSSQNSGEFTVVEYKNASHIEIEFITTGTRKITGTGNVIDGRVKDNFYPRVAGVGFIGDGRHKATSNRKMTKAYQKWSAMLSRCYDPKNQRFASYGGRGVTVCEEWHNFQNFAEWYYSQGDIDCLEMDKDSNGGSIYSPRTCVFLTKSENTRLAHGINVSMRSPSGVVYSADSYKQLANEHGLNGSHVREVAIGKRKSHKGWTKA